MPNNNKKYRRKLSTRIIIEENGYYLEATEVETEDGYILTCSRILKREQQQIVPEENGELSLKIPQKKPVVLLVHGFLCQAENWCTISADIGLPYKLLEEGYDVWLAHLRGTPLSRKHVSLNSSSKHYWDFSFHELGVYDLPAIINYILEATGNSSLTYIGHSMGCSIGLVLLSTKPEYCSKINLMIALAPAVYGQHIRKLVFKSVILFGNIVGPSRFITRREIANLPATELLKFVTPRSKREMFGVGILIGGLSKSGIEKERLRALSKEWPSPSSMKLFCHGLQCFRTNKARQYNYGRAGNMRVYGVPKPPGYDLSKVQVPYVTFSSEGDELCRPFDVKRLNREIPNLIGQYCIKDEEFSHLDFLIGQNAHEYVFKQVITILTELKTKESEKTAL